MNRILSLILTGFLLIYGCFPASAMTRSEIREAYQNISGGSEGSPYLEKPDPARPDDYGALTEAALEDALNYLNLLRGIAGLKPVTLNPLYTLRSQSAAALLAANDYLTHEPEKYPGMNEEVYASAYAGASCGNIAKFNWMRPSILREAVAYFARDDGENNLGELGHRSWLLNPEMAETGFGLANAASGMSYVVMYAVDSGNADAEWDAVFWPSAQPFPAELMDGDLPWSITLNGDYYDLARSKPIITLTEQKSGASFSFDLAARSGDGFCTLNDAGYGAGISLIFRPDLAAAGLSGYEQNQIFTVCVTGLQTVDGQEEGLFYYTEMVSLFPQDPVNVELSVTEAELTAGDTLQLTAEVIPAYADDLSVTWTSSDESVADVSAEGLVRACAAGSCEIIAASVNGRTDVLKLIVK